MDAKINVYSLLTTLYRFIFIIDNIQMSRNVSRNVCNYILTWYIFIRIEPGTSGIDRPVGWHDSATCYATYHMCALYVIYITELEVSN